MKKFKNIILIATISLVSIVNAQASTKLKMEEQKGKTEFLAVGNPGFLKINGKGNGPKAEFEIKDNVLNGKFEIDLKTLDTGMSLRNTHMKEKYLQIDKFPNAVLTIENQKLAENWSLDKPEIKGKKIAGQLEVHGVRKPVEVLYSLNNDKKIQAEFDIKISDFNIEIPSFMGVTVADKVTVKVESEIKNAN